MGLEMKDDGGQREVHREGAGKKEADKGRGHYELVSPLFMRRLAVWLEKGAEKYDARNWEKGIPMGRIIRALLRHTYQYLEGMRDEDHLAAIACNIMFLIHFEVGIERGLYSPEDVAAMTDLPNYVIKLQSAIEELMEDAGPHQHPLSGLETCSIPSCTGAAVWDGYCPTHHHELGKNNG